MLAEATADVTMMIAQIIGFFLLLGGTIVAAIMSVGKNRANTDKAVSTAEARLEAKMTSFQQDVNVKLAVMQKDMDHGRQTFEFVQTRLNQMEKDIQQIRLDEAKRDAVEKYKREQHKKDTDTIKAEKAA